MKGQHRESTDNLWRSWQVMKESFRSRQASDMTGEPMQTGVKKVELAAGSREKVAAIHGLHRGGHKTVQLSVQSDWSVLDRTLVQLISFSCTLTRIHSAFQRMLVHTSLAGTES